MISFAFEKPNMSNTSEEELAGTRTPLTDIVVGMAMIVAAAACGVAYLVILKGIFQDKDLMRMTSYRFMFFLGVVDVIQCLPHIMTGFFTIFQTTLCYPLNKAMGVLATPFYVAYAVMTVILSMNRFVQLLSPNWDRILFSSAGVKFWLCLASCFCLLYMLVLASPWASIIYFPEYYSWDYDHSLEYSWLVQKIEMFIEVGGIFVAAFFYFGVLGLLWRTRRVFRASRNFMVEAKILIQALVITVYCTILNVFWHNYEVLLPHSLWSYMGLNFMWILNSGIYPIIYFVVNKTIRDKVRVSKAERTIITKSLYAGQNAQIHNLGRRESEMEEASDSAACEHDE